MKVHRLLFIDNSHNGTRVAMINDVVTLKPSDELDQDAVDLIRAGKEAKVKINHIFGLRIHGKLVPAHLPNRAAAQAKKLETRNSKLHLETSGVK